MHMIRSRHLFTLAVIGAMVALGVTQASAQVATAQSPKVLKLTAGQTKFGPMSLKWIRNAVAEYRARGAARAVKPAITIGNFSDCPQLPAGDDPSQFLCILIHITGGELVMGHSTQIISKDMTVPFAEGTDPQGNVVLIPGTMRSQAMPVLGGIFLAPLVNNLTQTDPNLQLSVKPIGVGIAIDPTGNTAAFISQKIKAINPIFGSSCFVGSNASPITLDPTFGTTNPPPPNQPISGSVNSVQVLGNEIVIIGTVVDNAFAAPAAAGCGPTDALTQVVNEVSGLPSPAGTNTSVFQVTVEATSYTSIS
jgi:hypothetical protein